MKHRFNLRILALTICLALLAGLSIRPLQAQLSPGDAAGDVVNNSCSSSTEDCLFEALAQGTCVGTNGFFSQINILSILNKSESRQSFSVEYRNAGGKSVKTTNHNIESARKLDIIINELVPILNEIGSVCVQTSASGDQWTGGNTIYKVKSNNPFGNAFDYALHYPFQNARSGKISLPLNTYYPSSPPKGTVANWIAISDANLDGLPLNGRVRILNSDGNSILETTLSIPDGGRIDVPAHEGIGGLENRDAVGIFEFQPESSPGQPDLSSKYYITNTRYFYACQASECEDFRAAMVVPLRPSFAGSIYGGVSTVDNFLSVIELSNLGESVGKAELDVFSNSGLPSGTIHQPLASKSTRHVIVNRPSGAAFGFLSTDSVGSAMMRPSSADAKISAISFFYKLDSFGKLLNAYAAPFSGSGGSSQISEFNSFINQVNNTEIFNSSLSAAEYSLTYVDFLGMPVYKQSGKLPAFGSIRIPSVPLPKDTLGTILLDGNNSSLVLRNYVEKTNEYTLPFIGTGR